MELPSQGEIVSNSRTSLVCSCNILVLRTDLSSNPSFQELLRRVQAITLDAWTHQELPFARIVQELRPERRLNYSPLFQVMFNMYVLADSELKLAGLTVERLVRTNTDSRFDLTLYVVPEDQSLRLDLLFNTDLFDPARMEQMLEQYKHLLVQVVESPELSIGSYSLVTERASRVLPDPTEILSEPRFAPVTQEILAWVNRSPEKIAVAQEDRTWTYAELWAWSHSLAPA